MTKKFVKHVPAEKGKLRFLTTQYKVITFGLDINLLCIYMIKNLITHFVIPQTPIHVTIII